MKDVELRGIVLKHFYDLRHGPSEFVGPPITQSMTEPEKLATMNICRQLAETGLIEWKPLVGSFEGRGRITAQGVDVMENNVPPPIAVQIDNSVRVSGSNQHVIIGNNNSINVLRDAEAFSRAIDKTDAPAAEKTEAKGFIGRFFANSAVQGVLSSVIEGATKGLSAS